MLVRGCNAIRNFRRLFGTYYTKEHEWLNYDESSKTGVLGITFHAQEQLGEIVHIDLPELNSTYNFGEVVGAVESVKTVADIYSPISGKVLEVNESLKKTPEVINESPEQEGWIAKFSITNPDELKSLLSKKQYEEFCAGH